ncbi:MAG: efflux RND transporter periplasmic adaptor subunit [bacterium]|nr:efflux RND transporter periplasmic adaptor subunit [bacterium]
MTTLALCLAHCGDGGAKISGFVEGKEYLVRTNFAGQVEKVMVQEGQWVQKGQALAEWESDSLRNALKKAEAQLAVVEAQLEKVKALAGKAETGGVSRGYYARAKKLYDAGGISLAQLNSAKKAMGKNYTSSQAQVLVDELEAEKKQAEADLEDLRILATTALVKSPASGQVTKAYLHEGEVFKEGAPAFLITDTKQLYLSGSLPHDNLHQIKLGQPFSIHAKGVSQSSFRGELTWIAPKPDSLPSKTINQDEGDGPSFGVKIQIINENGLLKPGMEVTAYLTGQKS